MYLTLICLVILFACIAFMVTGGLWTNTLVLINTVTAGLIAFNYYEPLANWLDGKEPSYTYFWDFLSLWLVFAVAMGILRSITDVLSKVKVKFRAPFDQIGGIVMACIVGGVMIAFVLASLHTAPLARKFLAGNFQPKPDSRMFMGLDRQWLGFVRKPGSYGRSNRQFAPIDNYVQKYSQRRANFAAQKENRVATGS